MAKKLMICLSDISDRGKTETIIALKEKLEKLPKSAAETWFDYNGDICATVIVKKKKIGLCSHGDYPHVIEKWLRFLVEEQNCAIIFCASHTRGGTVWAVEEMAEKHGYSLIWTAPYADNTSPEEEPTPFQECLNRKKAEHLADFIDWKPA